MLRRRIAALVAALAAVGGGVAYAADGVGSNPGTTGQTRACQAHAANNGVSAANGLTCAPPASFTISSANTTQSPFCTVSVSGTGFRPGTGIDLYRNGALVGQVAVVGSDGTFSRLFDFSFGDTAYFTGTGADGSTVTSDTFTCNA